MVLLLLIGEALLVFVVRSAARPVWRTDLLANRSVLPLVALSLLVLPATVLIPSVATILHLAPPAPGLWLPALAVAATATLWVEPLKWLAGRSRMPR
jgi:hypothetical protein